MYADDTQKYSIFDLKDYITIVSKMEALVTDIRQWFYDNRLMCNDSKTEVLLISSRHKPVPDHELMPVSIGESCISPAPKVKNLGVTIDQHLTLYSHVNNIVRSAFLKIREISFYRRYLTLKP